MRTLGPLFLAALLGTPVLCAGQQVAVRRYTVTDGLAHNSVIRVFEDSRGFIWVATVDGVSRFDGHTFVTFGPADGLPRSGITRIGETNGALWFATRAGQSVRATDSPDHPAFVPDNMTGQAAGTVGASAPATLQSRIFEERLSGAAPLVVRGTSAAVSDILEDRSGNLWIGTRGAGIFTVPADFVVNYTAADELPDEHVVRIVESREGRIYAMTRRGGVAELRDDGVDAVPGSLFAPFHTIGRRIAQDENGVWWFRTEGGLFSAPGPALSFSRARLATEAPIALSHGSGSTFTDSRGWVWEPLPGRGVSLCTERGCIDYGTADGIGQLVTSMAEDAFGRVYFGTSRGLLRFDPRVRTFAAIPSIVKLAGSSVTDCVRDSRGRIWVATTSGVSSIVPQVPRSFSVPHVYLTSARVDGARLALPPGGTTTLPRIDHRARARNVIFEYVAPGARNVGIRYQHRLLPRDGDWSARHGERTASYASLAPGIYTFEVRAIAADGKTGPAASLRFRVTRPLWTWWTVAAGAFVLTSGCSLLQLQRANRRRNLAGMPLRVFGRMEEQAEDAGRHGGASNGPGFLQG